MLNQEKLYVNISLGFKRKHRENGRQTVTLGVCGHKLACHGENHNISIDPLHSLARKLWMIAQYTIYNTFHESFPIS